jgi:hypothetical protein
MKDRKMEEEKYYIIQTDDWDRYYWEVYVNDELVYIASRRGEAEEYIEKCKENENIFTYEDNM